MIQEIYQRTMKFAGEKHHEQKVPGSAANYLLHISNVAMEILIAHKHQSNFDLAYTIQVAILHDVLEDTETSFEELKEVFGLEVANGVLALTKNEKLETKQAMMEDSLDRINKQRFEVGIIKLADRITNLQTPPNYWTLEKIRTYLNEAKTISTQLKEKNAYLNSRMVKKIEEYHQRYCLSN